MLEPAEITPHERARNRARAARDFHRALLRVGSFLDPRIDDLDATLALVRAVHRSILVAWGASDLIQTPATTDDEMFNPEARAALHDLLDSTTWASEHDPHAPSGSLDPEILGYVFEQLVNGHQMGAYYTPTDASSFLVEHTVLARILDAVEQDMQPWKRVQEEPDRYLRCGMRSSPDHQRAASAVVNACRAGTVAHVDDAIAHNLDIGRLLRDTIDELSPAALQALLDAISRMRVLDPTCGSGAFLIASFSAIRCAVQRVLIRLGADVENAASSAALLAARALYGIDLMPGAIEICRMRVQLALLDAAGIQAAREAASIAHLRTANALVGAPIFEHRFDAIVGNPPFVGYSASTASYEVDAPATRGCGNLAAFTTERAVGLLAPRGRIGLVLPVSTIATARFAPLQSMLACSMRQTCLASFDTIPSTLFVGVVQRVVLLLGAIADEQDSEARSSGPVFGTRYRKWRADERPTLFDTIAFQPTTFDGPLTGSIPKYGSPVEHQIIAKIGRDAPLGAILDSSTEAAGHIAYKRRWSYFLMFVDFVPELYDSAGNRRAPTELKWLRVNGGIEPRAVLAALNSSLFYLYFSIFADNRNVNRREIEGFPLSGVSADHQVRLAELADELMASMRTHSTIRECTYKSVGMIRNQYFFQGRGKPIIDRIDAVLADHYGLQADELQHIREFEMQYRLANGSGVKPAK